MAGPLDLSIGSLLLSNLGGFLRRDTLRLCLFLSLRGGAVRGGFRFPRPVLRGSALELESILPTLVGRDVDRIRRILPAIGHSCELGFPDCYHFSLG